MPINRIDPFVIVLAFVIVIILILAFFNFMIIQGTNSICGDEFCDIGENQSNCCTDCGCPTGYVCSNFTCSIITSQCPNCPSPSVWSNCTENSQSRLNYYCNSSTDYNCQVYTETKNCTTNCTEGYLNSYRCSNYYRQRQYQYSNCSIVWLNFEYCTHGCINNECVIPNPTKRCLDGTQYGQCSETLPKYCDNGSLVDRCLFCGCPSGSCLSNGSCTSTAPSVNPYYCNKTCILISTSGDPYLYEIYYGYTKTGESIAVSCVSIQYYSANDPTYHYRTDVNILEDVCVCFQSRCVILPFGEPPPIPV